MRTRKNETSKDGGEGGVGKYYSVRSQHNIVEMKVHTVKCLVSRVNHCVTPLKLNLTSVAHLTHYCVQFSSSKRGRKRDYMTLRRVWVRGIGTQDKFNRALGGMYGGRLVGGPLDFRQDLGAA